MKDLKLYRKIIKISKKRELNQQIRISMRFIINLFHEDDKESIIKFMIYGWYFSNIISTLIICGLYYIINFKLGSGILTITACALTCELILILNYKESDLEYKKRELEFICRTMKVYNFKKNIFIILEYFKNEFLFSILCYYTLTLIYQVAQGENILVSFLICTMFCIILIISNLYFIYKRILDLKYNNIFSINERYFKSIMTKNEDVVILPHQSKSSVGLIIESQFKYNHCNKMFKTISIFVIISIVVLYIFSYFFHINYKYVTVILFSSYPTILNLIFIKILSKSLLSNNIINVNFYFIKKYNAKKHLMNISLRKLTQYTVLLPIIWSVIIIIANKFNWYCIVFSCLSIFQWTAISFIFIKRCYKYNKYDLDDIKLNVQGLMMSNLLEDYFLLGLPLIGCSFSMLTVFKTNTLTQFMLLMCIYTFIILIYALFMYFREMGGKLGVSHK